MNIKYTTFFHAIQPNIIELQKKLKNILDGAGGKWVITFSHNDKEQVYYCEYIHSSIVNIYILLRPLLNISI